MDGYAIPVREYVLVFVTAIVFTYLVTGLVRRMAVRIGAVTPIRDRDVHSLPTPRMGGVAVYLGVAASVLMAGSLPNLRFAFLNSTEIRGVLVAGAIIVVIGVLDDKYDLDSVTKLAGQTLAAGVMVLFGVQWIFLWNPGSATVVTLDAVSGKAITVLLTLVLANAMNFIDGLDGLLAGVAAIAAAGVFVFSIHQLALSHDDLSESQAPLLAAALAGACIGFLPHNFSPARIFMGDSGSMFIGLVMAAATTSASGKLDPSIFGARTTLALLAPVIVVLAVVFIPLLDFLLAVIRRTREGRHPFSADKRHLHHRMLAIGHTHRQAVLLFYLWAMILSGGAVSLVLVPDWPLVAWPFGAAVLLALAFSYWPWWRSRRRNGSTRRRRAAPARPGPAGGPLDENSTLTGARR